MGEGAIALGSYGAQSKKDPNPSLAMENNGVGMMYLLFAGALAIAGIFVLPALFDGFALGLASIAKVCVVGTLVYLGVRALTKEDSRE